jgi:hypothetical protein
MIRRGWTPGEPGIVDPELSCMRLYLSTEYREKSCFRGLPEPLIPHPSVRNPYKLPKSLSHDLGILARKIDRSGLKNKKKILPRPSLPQLPVFPRSNRERDTLAQLFAGCSPDFHPDIFARTVPSS